MDGICKSIGKYNSKNPRKILIVFDLSHKNLSNKPMVPGTLDRNISILVFFNKYCIFVYQKCSNFS